MFNALLVSMTLLCAQPAPSSDAGPPTPAFADLSPEQRASLTQYASWLRRGPDGSLWSFQLAMEDDANRKANKPIPPQFRFANAPLYVDLTDLTPEYTEHSAIRKCIRREELRRREARESKRRDLLKSFGGWYVESVTVVRVASDGLIIEDPQKPGLTLLLVGHPLERFAVDGETFHLPLVLEYEGRHQYKVGNEPIQTIGKWSVARTVYWDELLPPETATIAEEFTPVTPEELYAIVLANPSFTIPVYSHKRVAKDRWEWHRKDTPIYP